MEYALDCSEFELDERQLKMLEYCTEMADNNYSLRRMQKEYLVNKSVLHEFIQFQLPKISYELYQVVKRQMNNRKSRR